MEGVISSESDKGIIPRAVEALFQGVSEADENIEFTVKVSYVEIYLEKIRDLLDSTRLKNNLNVREDKVKGIYIAGVTENYVTSSEELLQIMGLGATNRAVAATGMNEGSSRSHSVFTITVGQKDVMTNATKSGKLVLVDLAGSEMVRKTNATGQQLEEAKMINKSLSALGQVINALTDEKAQHIPYRDSKLTRVLQDSLGGNSKTVLIIAVSPSSFNASETVSTLRFGNRAKSIENKAKVNQTRSVEELEALLQRAEKAIDAQANYILALTTQLQAKQALEAPAAGTVTLEEGKVIVDASKLEQDAATIRKLQDTINNLNAELDEEKNDSLRKDSELQQLRNMLSQKETLIQDAFNMVAEVKRSNEGLKERAEQLLREKVESVGEIESLRATRDDEIAKSKFQIMELEVTVNTLKGENKRLKDEIREITEGVGSKKTAISTETNSDDEEVPPSLLTRLQNTKMDDNSGGEALTDSQRKQLFQKYSEDFVSVCLKHNLGDRISTDIYSVFDAYAAEGEKTILAIEEKHSAIEKIQSRKVKDLEDQRNRLEGDLQSRIENSLQYQMKLESLGKDSRAMNDQNAERERTRLRNLQLRLEQLVAVHRQLLRKFASLEADNVEMKKKANLREERIKQLESNSRAHVSNIRTQAEKHVAEIATFREQLTIMKREFETKYEALQQKVSQDGGSLIYNSPNKIRTSQPKALRGGGGKNQTNLVSPMDGDIHFFGHGSSSELDSQNPPPTTTSTSLPPPSYDNVPPPPAPTTATPSAPSGRASMFSRMISRG